MINSGKEMQLMIVSGGVVVLTILGLIVFLLGINKIVFYLFVVAAIILGFYLAYNISREATPSDQVAARRKK